MLIISYDISDKKVRAKFSKMLQQNGCIRLQYSVYEFNNSTRLKENIIENIKQQFGEKFTPDDSVVIFNVTSSQTIKFGNAIHRDEDLLIF